MVSVAGDSRLERMLTSIVVAPDIAITTTSLPRHTSCRMYLPCWWTRRRMRGQRLRAGFVD